MAEKIQINIEDRDRLVELFGKINIEGYDHDTSAEFALFTRLLKLKAVRENYDINAFCDILQYYIDNGLSFNESISNGKDMGSKIYSFFTYAFTHRDNAKQQNNTRKKKEQKKNGVIEAQTEIDAEDRMKEMRENILADMANNIDNGIQLSNYEDPDFINNKIGCSKCISGYIQNKDGTWKFCDCYIKELLKTKYRKSGLPENYIKYLNVDDSLIDICAIKNYSMNDSAFKGIKLSQFIQRYKDNILSIFNDGWNLIIEGPPGTLKTTTACLLGKEAVKRGYTVLFTEMQQLRKIWIGEKLTEELEEYKQRLNTVDLLILDDFGQEFMSSNSDYQLSELDFLIRNRLSENKKFIITTNASKEQIEKRYSVRISSLLNTKMMHLFIKTKGDLRKKENLPNFF